MNDTITVGLELETVRLAPAAANLIQSSNFGRRYDSSIKGPDGEELPSSGPDAPVELVTPIMSVNFDQKRGQLVDFDFTKIDETIDKLAVCSEYTNSSCGLHVHLGKPGKEPATWNPNRLFGVKSDANKSHWKPAEVRTALLLCRALEERMFAVVPQSRHNNKTCLPIGRLYTDADLCSPNPVGQTVPKKHANPKRYCWVNLIETCRKPDPCESRIGYACSDPFGTIEIRLLGETKDPDYIKAWTHYWVKLAAILAYETPEMALLKILYGDALKVESLRIISGIDRHKRNFMAQNRSHLPIAA